MSITKIKSLGEGLVLSAFVSLMLATPAHAQANVENMAQSILNLLTGTLAKTAATIALVIVGYMYWAGRASLQLLITVIVGVFIVFSAGWIVTQITGG